MNPYRSVLVSLLITGLSCMPWSQAAELPTDQLVLNACVGAIDLSMFRTFARPSAANCFASGLETTALLREYGVTYDQTAYTTQIKFSSEDQENIDSFTVHLKTRNGQEWTYVRSAAPINRSLVDFSFNGVWPIATEATADQEALAWLLTCSHAVSRHAAEEFSVSTFPKKTTCKDAKLRFSLQSDFPVLSKHAFTLESELITQVVGSGFSPDGRTEKIVNVLSRSGRWYSLVTVSGLDFPFTYPQLVLSRTPIR